MRQNLRCWTIYLNKNHSKLSTTGKIPCRSVWDHEHLITCFVNLLEMKSRCTVYNLKILYDLSSNKHLYIASIDHIPYTRAINENGFILNLFVCVCKFKNIIKSVCSCQLAWHKSKICIFFHFLSIKQLFSVDQRYLVNNNTKINVYINIYSMLIIIDWFDVQWF